MTQSASHKSQNVYIACSEMNTPYPYPQTSH